MLINILEYKSESRILGWYLIYNGATENGKGKLKRGSKVIIGMVIVGQC